MTAKYYFVETNAYRCIIAAHGKQCHYIHTDSAGREPNCNVDLYPAGEDSFNAALAELREKYAEDAENMYNWDWIISDWPDDILPFDINDENFERIELIIAIEN